MRNRKVWTRRTNGGVERFNWATKHSRKSDLVDEVPRAERQTRDRSEWSPKAKKRASAIKQARKSGNDSVNWGILSGAGMRHEEVDICYAVARARSKAQRGRMGRLRKESICGDMSNSVMSQVQWRTPERDKEQLQSFT